MIGARLKAFSTANQPQREEMDFLFAAPVLERCSDATNVRNASTGGDISPSRHTSGVLISASALGNGCRATCACGMVSSTDSGTSATPAPAATQATIA